MDYRSSRTKNNQRSSPESRKERKTPLWKKTVRLSLILLAAGLLIGGGLFTYYAIQAPELKEEELVTPASSEVLDKNGNTVATVGTKQRDLVAYEDIPPLVENAILATEDSRFYKHPGIDPIRLGGAVIANLTEGFGSEGGSTITQQVVKRTLLSSEKTLKRKAQEAWLALRLEMKYSKEEIFEMYVNKIYYSDNIYGIQTASRYYFGKKLDELTLPQAALLAGIPQSPNNYNPYDYPARAKERRNVVLQLMEQHGKITEQEMEQAQQVPITEGLVDRSEGERSTLANRKGDEAFIDVVLSEMEEHGNYDLFTDGLKIHTTMDPDAQKYMETMLNSEETIDYPEDKNGDPFQAGITLLDTKTGAVRAIGGGRKYGESEHRGFNFATDTNRQPGSAIKPLLVYAPAIEKMQWSTAHVLIDEPIEYANGYQPRNWDDQFKGPVSIREALWDSRNIPAIKAFNQTGHEYAASFIEQLGFAIDEPLDESAAIGGGSANTNSFEMAGAFAALGNKGNFTEPYTVTKIELRDGTVIETTPETNKAMEPHTAFMVTDMLKSVIEHPEGTGTEAEIPGLPVAGKSGTTNYSEEERKKFDLTTDHAPDSWFVGYTTEYTAAVWTGYEHKENPLTPEERDTSQQIFKALMQHVSSQEGTADFEKPADVVTAEIEDETNPPKLPSAFTPEELIKTELFIEGTVPSEVSEEYIPDLQVPTGLSADYNRSEQTVSLNWNHSQPEGDNRQVHFEVTKAENGGTPETISTTEQQQLLVEDIQPDSRYTFTVTAVSESERSEPGVIRINTEIQEPDSPAPNEQQEDNNQDNGSSDPQENTNENNSGQEEQQADEPQDRGSEEQDAGNQDNGTSGQQESTDENNSGQEEQQTEEQQDGSGEQQDAGNQDNGSSGQQENTDENNSGQEEQQTEEQQDRAGEQQDAGNQDNGTSGQQENTDENNSGQEEQQTEEQQDGSGEQQDAGNQDNGTSGQQENTDENNSGQEEQQTEEQQDGSGEQQDAGNQDNGSSGQQENTDENNSGQEEQQTEEQQDGAGEQQDAGNQDNGTSGQQENTDENNSGQEEQQTEEQQDGSGEQQNAGTQDNSSSGQQENTDENSQEQEGQQTEEQQNGSGEQQDAANQDNGTSGQQENTDENSQEQEGQQTEEQQDESGEQQDAGNQDNGSSDQQESTNENNQEQEGQQTEEQQNGGAEGQENGNLDSSSTDQQPDQDGDTPNQEEQSQINEEQEDASETNGSSEENRGENNSGNSPGPPAENPGNGEGPPDDPGSRGSGNN